MRLSQPAAALLALACPPASADGGALTVFATGEALATGGFVAPTLTRDGWALSFDRVVATFDDVSAFRTDPPFAADGPVIPGDRVPFPGPVTLDLTEADGDDRVPLATVAAPAGHYNALAWSLVPAASGEFAGYALVLVGEATREGETVAFTLAAADRVDHACGEYVGEERKGFLDPGGAADLEVTLHLDHLFGRADLPLDDPLNAAARGFDPFSAGGLQTFTLAGLHLGHVGEGHCHVAAR